MPLVSILFHAFKLSIENAASAAQKRCGIIIFMKIGYARVSTDEENLDMQRAALEDAGSIQIFEDHRVSGSMATRPGLSDALAAMAAGDVLVV